MLLEEQVEQRHANVHEEGGEGIPLRQRVRTGLVRPEGHAVNLLTLICSKYEYRGVEMVILGFFLENSDLEILSRDIIDKQSINE